MAPLREVAILAPQLDWKRRTGPRLRDRQLHYLLTQTTSDGARLTARGNVALNGFESWRLLAKRFSLPDTAQNISLLTRISEFRLGTENFDLNGKC